MAMNENETTSGKDAIIKNALERIRDYMEDPDALTGCYEQAKIILGQLWETASELQRERDEKEIVGHIDFYEDDEDNDDKLLEEVAEDFFFEEEKEDRRFEDE